MTGAEAERTAALATLRNRDTVDRGLQMANRIEIDGSQGWKQLDATRDLVRELRAMLRAARVAFPLPEPYARFPEVLRQLVTFRNALAAVHRDIATLATLLAEDTLAERPARSPLPRALATATNVRTGMEMLRKIVDLCQLLFPELAGELGAGAEVAQ